MTFSEVIFILILFLIGLLVVVLVSLLPSIKIVKEGKFITRGIRKKYGKTYFLAVDLIEYYEAALSRYSSDEQVLADVSAYLEVLQDTTIDMYVTGVYTREAYLPDMEYFEDQVDEDTWVEMNANIETIQQLNKISYNNFKYKKDDIIL